MKNEIQTTIFLVRHGETHRGKEIFWSRKPGRSLNNLGRNQLEKTATYLLQFPIKKIFHSPSKRTTESAVVIKRSFPRMKMLISKELWEWDQGFNGKKIEGKPFAYFSPAIDKMYEKYPTKMIGGELLNDAIKRAVEFIHKLIFQNSEKSIVCVSHEDVIRGVVLFLRKENLDKLNTIPCAKGSIYELIFNQDHLDSIRYLDFNS